MADNKSASQTTKQHYEARPCTGYQKDHAPHNWHSHVANGLRWCDGKQRTWAQYSDETGFGKGGSTWTLKKNTDYLAETREDGKPWREDFDKPMTVREARAIAYHMHRNDVDKSGESYHLHLHAVQQGVVVLGGGTEEQVAALFHDSVEDGHTTYKHLREIGCTEHTINLIEAVSKRVSEEQNKYLERIIKAGPGAMRVKVADILHNTRHDRMEKVKKSKGEYTHDRLLKKYRPALARLMMELSLIVDEDEQKKIATKPQGTSSGWTGSTMSTSLAKPFNATVRSMLVGDWPTAWDAPVVYVSHGDGSSTFTLANGEVKAGIPWSDAKGAQHKLPMYAYSGWSTNAKVNPSGHASEDDILEFMNRVDEAKASKESAPKYEYGGDDLSGFWDAHANDWAGL